MREIFGGNAAISLGGSSPPSLFHRRPDAVDIVVIFERLKKLAYLGAIIVA